MRGTVNAFLEGSNPSNVLGFIKIKKEKLVFIGFFFPKVNIKN
jgi:hypothetical protein